MGQQSSHEVPADRGYKETRRRELLVKRIAQKMIKNYGTPYPDRSILMQEQALSKPGDVEFYYNYINRVYNPQTGQFRPDLNQRLHYNGQQGGQQPVPQGGGQFQPNMQPGGQPGFQPNMQPGGQFQPNMNGGNGVNTPAQPYNPFGGPTPPTGQQGANPPTPTPQQNPNYITEF